MASIKRIDGKRGTSFKFTVAKGRDLSGKQVRHYKTWTPPRGMTERQVEKEAQKVAYEFEQAIEKGFQADNRQTFAEYAEYVLDLKVQIGCNHRTLVRYRELLERINLALGHIKLSDIRPHHLNVFYGALSKAGIHTNADSACPRVNLAGILKSKRLTRQSVATAAGISASTLTAACKSENVSLTTAVAIAQALGQKVESLFTVQPSITPLSCKTILEHHRLIHTILAQAEKEMLIPYNTATKASPPKAVQKEVNYFQPCDIRRICDALNQEPLKWRVAAHLLLITGCCRREIMGLRWSRVDFNSQQLKIDISLLYSPDRGIYTDTTKTNAIRFIKLPVETMELLKSYRCSYLELKIKNGDRWQKDAWIGSDFLFTKDDGTPMLPDSLTAWPRSFSLRHSLPFINPHAFRHTMASVLINNGKDVVSISKRLGHAKVSTTTDVYSHIIQAADEQASK